MLIKIRNLTSIRFFQFFFFLLIGVIPILTQNVIILNILIFTMFYAFYACSWSIIGRYAGQISLGHAAYFGLGAYIPTILFLNYGLSPWFGMWIGGACAATCAVFLGFPCFRVHGVFYLLVTYAFAEIMRISFIVFRDVTGGSQGIFVPLLGDSPLYFQFNSKIPYYYIILLMLLTLFFIVKKLENSKFGYYLKALRNDEIAAKCVGIDVFKYKLIAAATSAFFTSFAGAFYIQLIRFIDPFDAMGIKRSIEPIIISLFGGSTISHQILGSFLLTPIVEYLTIVFGGTMFMSAIQGLIYGLVLIIVVIVAPDGIGGWLFRHFGRLLEKLKGEHHVSP